MHVRRSFFYFILILLLDSKAIFTQKSSSKTITIEWEKTFGGPKDEIGWSVQTTTDGGFIIGGFTDSYG